MQSAYPEFRTLNSELVAISMDGNQDAAQMGVLANAAYPILSDPNGDVAKQYGVYDLLGDGLAAPATFIVDDSGAIRWRYIGQNAGDRPTPQDIIGRLKDLES